MEFTKEELRMIETMAHSFAVWESQHFLNIAIKANSLSNKPEEYSMKCFKKAVEQYEKLMIISAKAGKLSEE